MEGVLSRATRWGCLLTGLLQVLLLLPADGWLNFTK